MIRILFLTANPLNEFGEPSLKLYREFESIDDRIQLSRYRHKFELIPRFSSSMYRLHQYILRFKPQIIHFSGHGTTQGELIFEDEYGGKQVANKGSVKSIFGILQKGIQCVLLNSCFSEIQAKLISQYVDCVIGMSDAIDDLAAIQFATNFYFGLGSGLGLKDAYELGRSQVTLLHIRDDEGNLIDAAKQSDMIRIICKQGLNLSKLKLIANRRRLMKGK